MKVKRIGLLGGSFDPIHNGHIAVALQIKQMFQLDKFIFVPAYCSPFKQLKTMTSTKHRLAMLKLSLNKYPQFKISTVELKRQKKSYTIDTLSYYRKRMGLGAEIYFILGWDLFENIGSWKRAEELFALSHFIVTSRFGYSKTKKTPQLIKKYFVNKSGEDYEHIESGKIVYIKKIDSPNVSGTMIRDNILKYKKHLEPDVFKYIIKNKLYEN